MRGPLQRLRSVGAKVGWIVMVASAVAVLAVSITAGSRTYLYLRQQSIDTVASQARIVAVNTSAPLAFGDREMATETLSSLRMVEGVERAVLYNVAGRPFAAWPAGPLPDRQAPAPGRWPARHGYVLAVPVADRAGPHGLLEIEVRNAPMRREAVSIALQTAAISLVALAIAWLLGRTLQPLLTDPIGRLDRAVQRVRDTGDYTLRVERSSDDELGQLTDAFNEMLERIDRSRRELLEAQRRAEESSRLKDEFLATVSHELRTPLSPILAWLQMLRMPQGATKLDAGLDVMERNARALVAIIDDLLDVSRIVSGTLRLDMHRIELSNVVDAAVETLAPTAQARGVRVDVERAALPPVFGDPARLQQVVWNLLSNAIKFTPTGGRVRVALARDGAQARLVVSDEGAGIEPQFLPHVFDRFRQQDGSITRTHGGLGLGLAIVRQLVELHGGTVDAASEGPGHGATFTVHLPLPADARAVAAAAPPAAVERAVRLDGVHVLLVEDHADMRAILETALTASGAVVRAVASVEPALAAVDEHVPDVLVSDIGLPDVDGYALLGLLRARRAEAAALPAIAVSAYVRPQERERAHAAGYAYHLAKPVDPAALAAAVGSLVSRGG